MQIILLKLECVLLLLHNAKLAYSAVFILFDSCTGDVNFLCFCDLNKVNLL